MGRNPITEEIRGGQSPRQRIWAQIRKHSQGFTQEKLSELSKTNKSVVQDYVKVLVKAGFIVVTDTENVGRICRRNTYKLIRDYGIEAPQINRKGELVERATVNEAMWGTLRRVLKGKEFNRKELAIFASTEAQKISQETANTYIYYLVAAGYLTCVAEAVRGKKHALAKYVFKANMDTGPRAPMIQRTKQVYDPNKNKVMFVEQTGDQDEVM